MGKMAPITLEQLIALNDEIAALARAGVPLEAGLRGMASDVPGRLGRVADTLADRLESGESLEHIIADAPSTFPPVYRAVVLAGLRGGRLPAALEGIASAARRDVELRRATAAAMVYPLMVMLAATFLFVFTYLKTGPVTVRAFELMHIERPMWIIWQERISEGLFLALPWFWGVVVAVAVGWYVVSARAGRFRNGFLSRVPSLGRVAELGRLSSFADLFALLLEQQVPLPEALELAGEASGDARLRDDTAALGRRMREGQSESLATGRLPPLLNWLIVHSSTYGNTQLLTKALREVAESYRQRAAHASTWLSVYLPIFAAALIGGTIGVYYVTMILGPFYFLLYQLGQP